jgi:hypothetical protein
VAISMLPREVVNQVALLPRDPRTGLLGLPASLADKLTPIEHRDRGDDAQGLVEYRLLGALALSGWSLRRALVAVILTGWPRRRATATPLENGTFKRACARLRSAGLWEEAVVWIAGKPCILVRLTPSGHDRLAAAGIACLESEWQRMEVAHNGHGENQLPHTGACCAFAYHARRHGYRTELVPRLPGPSEPDVLLVRSDDKRFYAEVQRRGGAASKRRAKWVNLAALQGFVAICAERPADAARFATEARVARLPGGFVTDLASLHRAESSADGGDEQAGRGAQPPTPGDGVSEGPNIVDVWTHYWWGAQGLRPYDPQAEEG